MPAVSQQFKIGIQNDPALNAIEQGERAMYLDMLLSDYYGKMVRQGNSFKITGVQASLQPDPESLGIDVGLATNVKLNFVPTTSHSSSAWRNVYKNWRNQKKLSTAVGSQVRYDDMEFGWDGKEGGAASGDPGYRARTSTILSSMTDAVAEKLTLTGASAQQAGVTTGQFSLQDYYNSAYSTPAASEDPFTGTAIKEPKWGDTPFPEIQTLICNATSSAGWFDDQVFGKQHVSAITMGQVEQLPQPANVLCGIFMVEAYVMPDDTLAQVEDEFILTVTVFVQSWKTLVAHRRKRRGKRSRRKGGYRGKRSWYRKRSRRRR